MCAQGLLKTALLGEQHFQATISELNLVQSSRPNLTASPGKGCMLIFQSNSTTTLDNDEQKLGNDLWHDSE